MRGKGEKRKFRTGGQEGMGFNRKKNVGFHQLLCLAHNKVEPNLTKKIKRKEREKKNNRRTERRAVCHDPSEETPRRKKKKTQPRACPFLHSLSLSNFSCVNNDMKN